MKKTRHYLIFVMACGFLGFSPTLMAQQPSSDDESETTSAVDSTSFELSAKIITRQDFERLPFRGDSQDYYGLFPGTVQQDFRGTEFLHIRGSRHDEIDFTFEGADVRSSFTGLNMIRFIPEAIDRIILQSSPSASSSNAAALLQHRLRRGSGDFNLNFRGETDRFTSNYDSRFGTYSYGYFNYLLTAEGKIFKDNIHFFVAGENEAFDDHYRKFWDGFRIGGADFPLVDRDTGQTLQEVVGTDEIMIRPGNIPNAESRRFTLNSIVTADFESLNLRAVTALNFQKQQQNDTPILHVFDPERIPEFKQNSGLLSLQADYAGLKDVNAHLQFDVLGSSDKTVDPLFDDNFFLYRDSLAIVDKGVNWDSSHRQIGDSYFRGPGEMTFYSFHFSRPGDLIDSYSKSEENYWDISGSVNKKFGNHLLNVGGQLQRRTLRRFNIGSSLGLIEKLREFGGDLVELNEDQLLEIRMNGNIDAYGYDIFGNEIEEADGINDSPKHPTEYSFYLEDRYRVKDFQLNAGLRYDSFSSDAIVNIDPANPEMFRIPGNPTATVREAPTHGYLSPRLSGAFFANDRLNFQFSFGKHVQQVRFSDVYASRQYRFAILNGGQFINDPRGMDAVPVRSTQTDLSVSYKIQPNFNLQTTLYYKRTNGLLETDRILTSPTGRASDYNVFANSGEALSKGVELSMAYHNKGFRTWINYTLSDVKGFTSYPISNLRDAEFEEVLDGLNSKTDPPEQLDFNQRHRGSLLMSYRFDKHAHLWLRQTGLHLLFRFNSGHNFTLYEGDFG